MRLRRLRKRRLSANAFCCILPAQRSTPARKQVSSWFSHAPESRTRIASWLSERSMATRENSWKPLDRVVVIELAKDRLRKSKPLNLVTMVFDHVIGGKEPPVVRIAILPVLHGLLSIAVRIEFVVSRINQPILIFGDECDDIRARLHFD